MKKIYFFIAAVFSVPLLHAQEQLAYDQNPDYAVSRAKYMKMADSLNGYQSTTSQETYKAIDYLADRKEARDARKQFRRDLRMEQARWNYQGYYYPGNMNYGYNNYYPFGNYHYNYFRPHYYNGNRNWVNPVLWSTAGSPFFWYWLLK